MNERQKLVCQGIIKNIESKSGKSLEELKKQYSEENLFQFGLKHVTTTKKAFCMAVGIPVEGGCRYKRSLEKDDLLAESAEKVLCPFTTDRAKLISTNRSEFAKLRKSNSNQIGLFDDIN